MLLSNRITEGFDAGGVHVFEHNPVMRGAIVMSFLGFGGACTDAPLCEVPAHTIYSCEPMPAGASGCIGGPTWSPAGSATDARSMQDDPDTTFARGCRAQVPDCSPFYRGSLRSFECSGEPLQWVEAL